MKICHIHWWGCTFKREDIAECSLNVQTQFWMNKDEEATILKDIGNSFLYLRSWAWFDICTSKNAFHQKWFIFYYNLTRLTQAQTSTAISWTSNSDFNSELHLFQNYRTLQNCFIWEQGGRKRRMKEEEERGGEKRRRIEEENKGG